MMNRIPLYLLEEHHEAFAVWCTAAQNGEIRPFGNTLLHIDHHDDFVAGGYPVKLSGNGLSLGDAIAMSRHALGIANFICPAIWYGLFNDIVFVGEISLVLRDPVERLLTLSGECELTLSDVNLLSRKKLMEDASKHRLFAYRQGGLGSYHAAQPCVLDVDLDYFCWDDSLSTAPAKRLEITHEAYEAYQSDPYHPFRILPVLYVTAYEEDGRCYLVYEEHRTPPEPPSDKTVLNRVKLFLRWLATNEIRPQIISVCRSRYSGYTPTDRWELIEQNLLKGLHELYDLASREGWTDCF